MQPPTSSSCLSKEERQGFFNLALLGIKEQGSLGKVGTACSYRTEAGNKCAVGQLLSEEAIEALARKDKLSHPVEFLAKCGDIPAEFRDPFFSDLQAAHDVSYSVREFFGRCSSIAVAYGLTPPFPLSTPAN
jgi:hypothetical protein